jgi:hypothetical protein
VGYTLKVTGIKEISAKLKKAPAGFRVLLTVVAQTLVEVLREYAPWKKITRESVYGSTFKTDRQRRAFFAKLRSGEISVPFRRTGAQGKAWRIESVDNSKASFSNRSKGVGFTRGENQTKLHAVMGWVKAITQARQNLPRAIAAGKLAFLAWWKS